MAAEELKNHTVEQIWLKYFNRVLFDEGIVTETERNKMAQKIESRKPSTQTKKTIAR